MATCRNIKNQWYDELQDFLEEIENSFEEFAIECYSELCIQSTSYLLFQKWLNEIDIGVINTKLNLIYTYQ